MTDADRLVAIRLLETLRGSLAERASDTLRAAQDSASSPTHQQRMYRIAEDRCAELSAVDWLLRELIGLG